jgi:mannose-1-phosphate guanylyltransferase
MAGGIGSRFWPMSRQANPKQFHDMLGVGKSLIRLTFERFAHQVPLQNIMVVTHESYVQQVLEHLPELSAEQVLAEPHRKNTAPCIAYAAHRIAKIDPLATMVVAASDHLILREDVFLNSIRLAVSQAEACECLITLGIRPTRPDTGYGYIQFTEEPVPTAVHPAIKRVKTFTEKPDLDLARQFLDSGEFYWNSGMFVWSIQSILSALQHHIPEMAQLFNDRASLLGTAQEATAIEEIYTQSPGISIDYGVMEKAANVLMLLTEDFGWSDLGTWGSLYTHVPHDDLQNGMVGKDVVLYNSVGNMVRVPEGKLAVVQGLTDYIVVDTEEVLLIVRKEDEQRIKEFVNDLKARRKDCFL